MTAAAILELSRRGETDEALSEKAALAGRTLSGWAFKTAGLPLPHDDPSELAAPLGIGLGTELRRWLLDRENCIVEVEVWLREYGSRIQRFEIEAARF